MADLLEREAERLEDLCAYAAALARHAEEEMFGPDVAVPELARLVDGELDHLFRPRRERDLGRRRRRLTASDLKLDRRSDLCEIDAKRIERARRDTFAFTHEAEQQVLDTDVVVVEADRLVLREGEDAFRAVVEPVEWSGHAATIRPAVLVERSQ